MADDTPDKTYHFEQEIKRLADATEAMQGDLNLVKLDVAVIKNQRHIVTKQNAAKPASLGGIVGGFFVTIVMGFYEYISKH